MGTIPLRTALKFRLYQSRWYRPIRFGFLAVFDRPKLRIVQRAAAFYRPFIPNGALVFDIGANLGEYAETFATLGARVLAIEPNTDLAHRLQGLARHWPVSVEAVAVGAEIGVATLHMRAGRSDLSTISTAWKKTSAVEWTHTIEVPVTTVDALVAKYGVPHFLKVDTEGHDDQVAAGMTCRPPFVSFELLAADRTIAVRVIERLGEDYRYNYTLGERFELQPQWLTARELITAISSLSCPEGYGDIIAQCLRAGCELPD
jgi:FkbM family methyltransferase